MKGSEIPQARLDRTWLLMHDGDGATRLVQIYVWNPNDKSVLAIRARNLARAQRSKTIVVGVDGWSYVSGPRELRVATAHDLLVAPDG